jgi:hypothetical protein
MEHKLEEVFAWLEAGAAADYQAGVLVLQKHTGNRSLVNLLLKKESVGNREKLVYELIKIGCEGRVEDISEVLNHFAQAVQGAVPQPTAQVVEALGPQLEPEQPAPAHMPDELRPQVDDLTQLMSKVYGQRVQLSNSLYDLSEAETFPVVAQILALEAQYNALAKKRGNVLAGEAAAPEQPTIPAEQSAPEAAAPGTSEAVAPGIDRAALITKRNSLRSNISKAKKKAEESKTEAKRSEYAQKAGCLAVELAMVELQLALPQTNA